MTSLRPVVLLVAQARPAVSAALTDAGFDVHVIDIDEVSAGMAGGDVLVLAFEDHADPLSLLARLWCAEPDLCAVTLDDGDPDRVAAALRAGVAASVSPPHRPEEIALVVHQAWQRKSAGVFQFQRDLARTMSTIAAVCGMADDRRFLQVALEEVARLFSVKRCSVLLVDHDDEEPCLRMAAHMGIDTDPEAVVIPVGTGIAGRVAQDGIPQLLLREADRYERFSHVSPNAGISASLSVPMRAAGERGSGSVVGVLNLARTDRTEVFTPLDLELCEFIASLLGQTLSRIALDSAQAELQRKMAATEKLAYAGEVAAGIAHEVASPIGYLRANIKVLSDYAEDLLPILEELRLVRNDPVLDEIAEDLPCLIDECGQGIERATRIVQDMKAMVRVDASERPKVPVDVAETVKGALRLLRPRLADRCQVQTHFDEELLIDGNDVELSQVLTNLIVNGLDACLSRAEADPDHTPRIVVRAERFGKQCVLSVADNGTGISPRDQARIFAPLFTTKPSGVGTGLGLGVVKRIVSSHDGTIELSSTLGEGTTFRLLFPTLNSAPEPATDRSAEETAASSDDDSGDDGAGTTSVSL